jgi:hypothetical protein
MTASPLAAREAQSVLNLPVLDLDALGSPEIADVLGTHMRAGVVLETAL